MEKDFKKFPGKVLLFGEYVVINGGDALAAPLGNFGGSLKFRNAFQEDNLSPFIQYLGALPNIFLKQDLLEQMEFDRLVFDSDIPIGYGAGSSGALTAAIFDAFVETFEGTLQEALASMEDFFHGSSSGLDPLISYTGKATGEIHPLAMEHFYLLDTGISRKTAPLVEIFRQKNLNTDDLEEYNQNAIHAISNYDFALLKESIEQISLFQYEHFQEMIPDAFRLIWKEVMGDSLLNIKLCGAGGGGFLLMFSNTREYIEEWAREKKLDLIKIKTLT
ncbi:mevalonate kinase family protein [Portibacter marinus]|uniref:mevalonate kinase family protein n=1 Tax=Portibacter marinus TaxID=2898660 RepID=UPI001F32A7DE|nr:hypothetical protein [Portibacter marinus]